MIAVVIATRSADKLREIRQILGAPDWLELRTLEDADIPELPEESGIECYDTFEENALAKARYFAARASSVVLADDSGLCVDALDGAPGVLSKRFSGRDDLSGKELDLANNRLLLDRLQGVPEEKRSAQYVCAVALVDPLAGWEQVTRGTCEGAILPEPRGSGGFGYDPLFLVPGEGATFGEIEPARKNQVSHRAHAVRAAAEILRARFDTKAPS